MQKLLITVFIVFALMVIALAIHRHDKNDLDVDSVAHWAVDKFGPGYSLIKVKKVKKQAVDGTLYKLNLKVRKFRLGGFSETVTCKVKILIYKSNRYLTDHRCFGSDRRPIGSSQHGHSQ